MYIQVSKSILVLAQEEKFSLWVMCSEKTCDVLSHQWKREFCGGRKRGTISVPIAEAWPAWRRVIETYFCIDGESEFLCDCLFPWRFRMVRIRHKASSRKV